MRDVVVDCSEDNCLYHSATKAWSFRWESNPYYCNHKQFLSNLAQGVGSAPTYHSFRSRSYPAIENKCENLVGVSLYISMNLVVRLGTAPSVSGTHVQCPILRRLTKTWWEGLVSHPALLCNSKKLANVIVPVLDRRPSISKPFVFKTVLNLDDLPKTYLTLPYTKNVICRSGPFLDW